MSSDNHEADLAAFDEVERELSPLDETTEAQQEAALNLLHTDAHQVPLEGQPVPAVDPDTSQSQTNDVRLLSLFTRIQALERDYSLLQGRVEELEHLYQEERHTNRRRFLDMDRRLREQFGGQLSPQDALTVEDTDSEIGIFRRGMSFIDADNYDQARESFQRIVNEFPNGEKVADAMYWLAELHHNVEPKNLERARQYFVQMVTLYPDHARIPEAMAKLGMIYHELGNVTRALEYFDRVSAEFPDHDAARLAETYAQELR